MTYEWICGGCGQDIDQDERTDLNSLCSSCSRPHLWLSRLGEPPTDQWECQYCSLTGTMDTMETTDCPHEYETCKHCGLRPYCAPNCKGISSALNQPNAHVSGFGPME
jgi:hypothetical protein